MFLIGKFLLLGLVHRQPFGPLHGVHGPLVVRVRRRQGSILQNSHFCPKKSSGIFYQIILIQKITDKNLIQIDTILGFSGTKS
jgi:hypothetical protein